MSGVTARLGFQYQDYLLIQRTLQFLLDKRCAEISGLTAPPDLNFSVEAPISDTLGAADSPEWDLQQENLVDGSLLLEEVKSGGLKPDDRVALWRRVRRSLNRLPPPHTGVRVRLTINPDRPPENIDRWRLLPTLSQTISCGPDPRRVSSAEELATEALFYLMESSAGESGLSETAARDILARFEVQEGIGESILQSTVRDMFKILTGDDIADSVCDAIYGYVADRATKPQPNERRFTASDLGTQVELLRRLLVIEPLRLQLWRSLQQRSVVHKTGRRPFPQSGLPYQDWRHVQPAVATAVAASARGSFAFVGRGGLGKTVLLEHLQAEDKPDTIDLMVLSGSDLSGTVATELPEAIALGTFISAAKKRRLHIYIDGFESVADTPMQAQTFAAALARIAADPNATVRLSCRATVWHGISSDGSPAPLPSIELREWDEHEVRRLVGASHRPEIGQDLIRLLRTPLLLDIFLRTFGLDQPIPAGLHTRHAVLTAYWERRILPPGHPQAPARRTVIDRMATEEAQGVRPHLNDDPAAIGLESEGLLVGRSGGFFWRHPLLRDFAIAQQFLMRATSAMQLINSLSAISDSLVRFGSIRATVEAASTHSSSNSRHEGGLECIAILRAIAASSCANELSDVIGEMEDISGMLNNTEIQAIFDASANQELASRTIQIARFAVNEQWLSVVAGFPDHRSWAQQTPWVSAEFLSEISQLLVVCEKSNPILDQSRLEKFRSIARRVREWSQAPKLQVDFAKNHGWLLGAIADRIVRFEPTPATLTWLHVVANAGQKASWWVLGMLPIFLKKSMDAGISIPGASLSSLYLSAAKLARQTNRLLLDHSANNAASLDFARINVALLGESKPGGIGLLDYAPSVFISLTLDIVGGYAFAEVERRRKQNLELSKKIDEAALEAWRRESIADFLEEYQLAANSISISANETGQPPPPFVIDILSTEYWSVRHPIDRLIAHLRQMLRKHLSPGDTILPSIFWPSVQSTNSALGRVIILHELLLSNHSSEHLEIIKEILRDERLYYFTDVNPYIAVALQRYWSAFEAELRGQILAIIMGARRPPQIDAVFCRAQLLNALPRECVPPAFVPLLAALEARQWGPPVLPSEDREDSATFEPANEAVLDQYLPAPSGMSESCGELWRRLRKLSRNLQTTDSILFSELLHALQSILTCLPNKNEFLSSGGWPASTISMLLYEINERKQQGRLSVGDNLSRDEISAFLTWALEVARTFPLDSWVDRDAPIEFSEVSHGSSSLWSELMNVANVAISMLEEADRHNGVSEYLNEIRRVRANLPGSELRDLLQFTAHSHWLAPGGNGRELLLDLLMTSRDGGVLAWGLHCLQLLQEKGEQVLRRWLLENDWLPLNKQTFEFVGKVGEKLGGSALRQVDGDKAWWQVFIDEILTSPPTTGCLATPSYYRSWLFGIVFGAKTALYDPKKITKISIQDYVALMNATWSLIRGGHQEGDHPQRFSLFAFSPILNAPPAIQSLPCDHPILKQRQALWSALTPLMSKVLQEGSSDTVYDILFALRERTDLIGSEPAQRMELVESIAARVRQEGSTLLASDDLTKMENWSSALQYGCLFLINVSLMVDDTDPIRARILEILRAWESLGVFGATEAARSVRVQPG